MKGKYGLPEGLDYWDAPHILHRFIAHILQSILVLAHILCHGRTRHLKHHTKCNDDRHQARKSEPPVVEEQHHHHCQRCHNRLCHIR